MVIGIVLAAGQSRRMGRPKARLDVDGETFLGHAMRVLAEGGCDDVVVVLDPSHEALAAEVQEAGGRPVWGAGPESEQIDSLRSGLRSLPDSAEAAVVIPVDHPLVATSTVTALIREFGSSDAPIVVPRFEGKRGHPVLFATAVFDEILGDAGPEGARSVVHAHENELVEVDVDDRGVTIDVNTPEDYASMKGSEA